MRLGGRPGGGGLRWKPVLRTSRPKPRSSRGGGIWCVIGKATSVITQNIDGLHQDFGISRRQGDRAAWQHDLRTLPTCNQRYEIEAIAR